MVTVLAVLIYGYKYWVSDFEVADCYCCSVYVEVVMVVVVAVVVAVLVVVAVVVVVVSLYGLQNSVFIKVTYNLEICYHTSL